MFFLSKSFLGGPRGGVKIRRRRRRKKRKKKRRLKEVQKGRNKNG